MAGAEPPWTDVDRWRARQSAALVGPGPRAAREAVLIEWATAAGGTARDFVLALPADITPCLALIEMKALAQAFGYRVAELAPAE